MLSTLLLSWLIVLLALVGPLAAAEDAMYDGDISADEPHVVHRFIAVDGKPTTIKTRLSDLRAEGYEVEITASGEVRLSRDGKSWTGHDETLAITQWVHSQRYAAEQRERLGPSAQTGMPPWGVVRPDEPHVVHRFIAIDGRPTTIRTRLSDLRAAGFEVEMTASGEVRLSRDGKSWTGHDETLHLTQWFHTQRFVVWQRDRIAFDPHYEMERWHFPHYPSKRDGIRMTAKVKDLEAAGYKVHIRDTGQPALIDAQGREIGGREWHDIVTKVWYVKTYSEKKRRDSARKKMLKMKDFLSGNAQRGEGPGGRPSGSSREGLGRGDGSSSGPGGAAGGVRAIRLNPSVSLAGGGLARFRDNSSKDNWGSDVPGIRFSRMVRDVPAPKFSGSGISGRSGTNAGLPAGRANPTTGPHTNSQAADKRYAKRSVLAWLAGLLVLFVLFILVRRGKERQ